MKHEPLKNKMIMFKTPWKEQCFGFEENSVKSAVEGLKQELTSFMEKNPALETWVYRRVMKMIDRWFEDVIG